MTRYFICRECLDLFEHPTAGPVPQHCTIWAGDTNREISHELYLEYARQRAAEGRVAVRVVGGRGGTIEDSKFYGYDTAVRVIGARDEKYHFHTDAPTAVHADFSSYELSGSQIVAQPSSSADDRRAARKREREARRANRKKK